MQRLRSDYGSSLVDMINQKTVPCIQISLTMSVVRFLFFSRVLEFVAAMITLRHIGKCTSEYLSPVLNIEVFKKFGGYIQSCHREILFRLLKLLCDHHTRSS